MALLFHLSRECFNSVLFVNFVSVVSVFQKLRLQDVLKALVGWVSTVSLVGDRKSNFVSLD